MPRKQAGRGGLVIAGLGFGAAIGVAFGTLMLGPAVGGVGAAGGVDPAELEQAVRDRDAARGEAAFGAAAAQALAPKALDGALAEKPIIVLATHSASPEDVSVVTELLRGAGATDAGRIELSEKFTTQDGADELKSLVTNTLPAGAQLSEDNLRPGIHAGEGLGSALMLSAADGSPQASDGDRAALLRVLADSGFLSYGEGGIRPAAAIVVVSGAADGDTDYSSRFVADFAGALGTRGSAVVLTGPTGSDALGVARDMGTEQAASTVEGADGPVGRGAVVAAVAEQLTGGGGNYGPGTGFPAAAPRGNGGA